MAPRRRFVSGARVAKRVAAGLPVRLEDLPCPTEHEEQVMLIRELVKYYDRFPELRELTAIPNGGVRNARMIKGKRVSVVGLKLKLEGTQPGYPDLLLDVPRRPFHGLRIEMKRLREGETSPEQEMWLARLEARGYAAKVCKGWRAALEVLLWYIALPHW